VISTPAPWHALQVIHACETGEGCGLSREWPPYRSLGNCCPRPGLGWGSASATECPARPGRGSRRNKRCRRRKPLAHQIVVTRWDFWIASSLVTTGTPCCRAVATIIRSAGSPGKVAGRRTEATAICGVKTSNLTFGSATA